MSSSFKLWQRLPEGFLKRRYRGWSEFDGGVQLLIVELATKQKFKCALCNQTRGLIIEHDHDPYEGPGDRYTVHNIRGLVCDGCNHHIKLYEMQERGEYHPWENVYSNISDDQYEEYSSSYEYRLHRLREQILERRCPNYWDRRRVLDKFDAWREWGETYPWRWGFEEIKEKRYGKIRTPCQAVKTLIACMQFVVEEKGRNPDWQPPELFLTVMARINPLMESLRPLYEAQLRDAQREGVS